MSSDEDATFAATPHARSADTIVEEGVEQAETSGSAPAVDARHREPTQASYDERYQARRPLGRGGMGEVHLCLDTKIGRDVAVKVMLEGSRSRARERFLREGRVQAQLEHPGVVPVYDLGITPSGQPYMAMKRVKGVTLQAVLQDLANGDEAMRARHSRGSLLSVMERVCETMAYAHARGVVHRDLKPANVMLGDYGEVSVLDWGLAKLQGESDLEPAEGPTGPASPDPDFTVPGSVVGTVSYMAPEQAAGDGVDARADVYSLGAMLYEVVTLERLHPERTMDERLTRSLRGVDARPSSKVPGVPPELDAICVRATQTLRAERYASASELLDDLRAFLAGERASELRRELADRHVQAARTTLAQVSSSETVRVSALRELGAAVVLDPNNREMIEMIEALLSPTAAVPREVERELEASRQRSASRAAARSGFAYLGGIVALPLLAWMGVRDLAIFALVGAGILAAAAGAFAMWRSGRSTGLAAWVSAPFAFALVGTLSTLFGPFFLVPALAVTTSVAFTISVRPSRALQRFLLVCGWGAVLVPALLTAAGVTPPSLRFTEGLIEVLPRLASFPELPTSVFLTVVALFLVTVANVLTGRMIDSLSRAERRLFVQAHRLRAMLPDARPSP
ncbi:MAG: serine/threonine protein kinase [Sandaracinaceae bacterium]|nr:serine/threonine protein kinase [Sandaracinaceae bacterium]